jgi:hypothetical protein
MVGLEAIIILVVWSLAMGLRGVAVVIVVGSHRGRHSRPGRVPRAGM